MKESEKLILEFSKEQYAFELEQQSTLNNYISVPIGIVTVVAGSLSFIFADPPNWWSGPAFALFFAFYSLAIISVIATIVFIFLHQTGLKYQRVPSPEKVKDYHDRILAANPNLPNLTEHAAQEVEDLIYDEYRHCAEVNFEKNLKKGYRFRVIKGLLLVAVSFTVISYGLYNFVDKPEKVSRIYIENVGGIGMTGSGNDNSNAPTPVNQAPTAQAPATPVAVSRPVPRVVTESFNPNNLVGRENAGSSIAPVAVERPVSRRVQDSAPSNNDKE